MYGGPTLRGFLERVELKALGIRLYRCERCDERHCCFAGHRSTRVDE